jgi:hypothetical protein
MIRTIRSLLLAAALMLSLASLSLGTAQAKPKNGDACVRDFFTVSRVDYGLNPHEIVEELNPGADPDFQFDNVGQLRSVVSIGDIGVVDSDGVEHVCAN